MKGVEGGRVRGGGSKEGEGRKEGKRKWRKRGGEGEEWRGAADFKTLALSLALAFVTWSCYPKLTNGFFFFY